MNWEILSTIQESNPRKRRAAIVQAILSQRGFHTQKAQTDFLHPPSPLSLTPAAVGLNPEQVDKAASRIQQAVAHKEPIVIFGDYDTDGVTATAIIWEALHKLGANAYPFIPSRDRHGYGLSVNGIKEALSHPHLGGDKLKPLFITVDNGIVAYEGAEYLKDHHIDLILTDHHQAAAVVPPHVALVHTTLLAGAGVAWMLAGAMGEAASQTLDLATIGTVADMVPLLGPNRALVKSGLEALQHSPRLGLQALFDIAGVSPKDISTYHINYLIAPRLNAMGRLEHALDSLRLLLTHNPDRAQALARLLSDTNVVRQDMTQTFMEKAQELVGEAKDHLLLVADDHFHEGVIGLVAGKLVERYYRPAIVIARGKTISKASVRSVPNFDIISYLRRFQHYYLNVGGHPMAAGFTIETEKIDDFKAAIQAEAWHAISPEILIPRMQLDCEINLEDISMDLFRDLETLKPFGIGNRAPAFGSRNCRIVDVKTVGKTNNHLKMAFQASSGTIYTAIGFNLGARVGELTTASHADIAFSLEENVWNGSRSLQLHLKDIALA